MRVEAADVTRVLSEWLVTQRWYAGKSRKGVIQTRLVATLADDPVTVQIWIADVDYGGQVEHYQIPVVLRAEVAEQGTRAAIGAAADPDSGKLVQLYDALYDKDVTGIWLDRIVEEAAVDGLRFTLTAEKEAIPVGEQSLALSVEQSNTSLVFGGAAIMKVFRRIEAGLNPDIEVHAALGRLGGRNIARQLGYLTAEIDGELWSLAMLQEFMRTGSDGWLVATGSVRDLMAEADLHADEAGGDFAGEAHRLGVSTAEVHADLAEAFGTAELSRDELRERAAAMNVRLDSALAEVPALAGFAEGLRRAYADLAAFERPVRAQRIHGDLHLGQVLRTVHRWVFLDFEGEPAKSIVERQSLDSPIRDVAGMLRSFDYAARHQLIDIGATSQSEFRAAEWANRNRGAFCAGYAQAGGADPVESAVLLRAFEADKAVYELVYEARNRPNWLPIPLASLQRLAQSA